MNLCHGLLSTTATCLLTASIAVANAEPLEKGSGLLRTSALVSLADAVVSIPMGDVESLNAAVAGSILMYDRARLRTSATQ